MIRKATINDAEPILKIRNNKIIRELSNNNTLLSLNEHIKWFKNKLLDEKNVYLVSISNNLVIWYCRLDYIEKSKYMISIAIIPESNSKWIWTSLFKESINYLNKWSIINAEILESNIKSINFFTKLGFDKINDKLYQLQIK